MYEARCAGLHGPLPRRTAAIEQQVALELEHLRLKQDNPEKCVGSAALHDPNKTPFHRWFPDHLKEMVPIVYSPTVGDTCRPLGPHGGGRPTGCGSLPIRL